MNWDAIGAVAELLGAIGVIGSLVYLARQIASNSENISHNTRALVASTDISSNQMVLQIYAPQISDPLVADLVQRGYQDFESLDKVDKHRFSMLVLSIFETHQTYFLLSMRGIAGEQTWDYYSRTFDALATRPGIRQWWSRNRRNFDPEFIDYIDPKFPIEP
jgi:hypothetical protein